MEEKNHVIVAQQVQKHTFAKSLTLASKKKEIQEIRNRKRTTNVHKDYVF
jgi:hypothetical protein